MFIKNCFWGVVENLKFNFLLKNQIRDFTSTLQFSLIKTRFQKYLPRRFYLTEELIRIIGYVSYIIIFDSI